MEQLHGFAFVPLRFDANGRLTSPDTWTELKQQNATDVILLAHGFRNDEADARELYGGFLRTFRENLERVDLSQRTFVVGGVLWPSKSFRESFGSVQSLDDEASARQQLEELKQEISGPQRLKLAEAEALLPQLEDDPENQDRFVDLVLSTLAFTDLGREEGLQQIRAQVGSELLDKLRFPVILPTEQDDSEGGALGIGSFAGSIFGRVGQFLNMTTWYLMKERSGIVGANGVAQCVRELKQRVHLVGHSLGGRLMASCAKSLAQNPKTQVDSLMLLQAAFSHFGLSAGGYFCDILDAHVVKGPLVTTFSFQDTVVGLAYAIASRLAGDNVKAIGDRNDPFGGIGRNGPVNLVEAVEDRLHAPGAIYSFRPGVVLSLDGSGGLIREHGDVTNAHVTYAFASAVAHTV